MDQDIANLKTDY